MSENSLQNRVNDFAAEIIRQMIEFCLNENIGNPEIIMEASVTDGTKYKLIFERTDLDN